MQEHDRIREYLGNVLKHGDICAVRNHAPSVKAARDRLENEGLVRWDPNEGRFLLTSFGLSRLSSNHPRQAVVLQFKSRAAA